jgi:hypothetical protein
MSRLRTSKPRLLAVLAAGALSLPAHALANESAGGALAPAGPGGATATPTGVGPDTLRPPSGGVLVHRVALLHGSLTAEAGRGVVVELLDPQHGWTAIGNAVAGRDGSFSVPWRAPQIGRFTLRARAAGDASASAAASTPATQIEVYRPVVATIFGPGFYGSTTACGQRMTAQLVGVAHRTLPCGTLVDIVYGDRMMTVPVVDRGPYAHGVSYDLTTAAAEQLGVNDTVHIGALALRGRAAHAKHGRRR